MSAEKLDNESYEDWLAARDCISKLLSEVTGDTKINCDRIAAAVIARLVNLNPPLFVMRWPERLGE